MGPKKLYLFGGEFTPWSPVDWTDSDDRVRGGKSQSYISASPFEPVARFYGSLDIDTLGGAGFASQRTTGEERTWNLEEYNGIEIEIEKCDEKQYTFILKDTLLPPDPETDREQSTVSYEYDFKIDPDTAQSDSTKVCIPFSAFTATYRGREVKDAPALNRQAIKRCSIMMRSFFGTQQGPFSLSVRSISAYQDQSEDSLPSLGLGNAKLLIPIGLVAGTLCLTGFFILVIEVLGRLGSA